MLLHYSQWLWNRHEELGSYQNAVISVSVLINLSARNFACMKNRACLVSATY